MIGKCGTITDKSENTINQFMTQSSAKDILKIGIQRFLAYCQMMMFCLNNFVKDGITISQCLFVQAMGVSRCTPLGSHLKVHMQRVLPICHYFLC